MTSSESAFVVSFSVVGFASGDPFWFIACGLMAATSLAFRFQDYKRRVQEENRVFVVSEAERVRAFEEKQASKA